MSRPAARNANLLGTVGLAVSDRIRAAGEEELGLGGSAPIAIVALSTYLADRPLDEIAGAFGITASAVVRLVDRLEQEGLARRHPGPDGRRVSVRLTAKGERRAKSILARREEELDRMLGVLSGDEQEQLTRLHEKLLGHLPDGVAGAARVCRYCDVLACGHYDGRCPVTRGIDARGLRTDPPRSPA
jgi:MarR family transcriptional regulator, negative regulator of the multidrug operon emrRAB